MAAGPRGLLAFWMGGAGAAPAAEQGGVRSLLAPWMGGACTAPEYTEQGGFRSLLGFWMGGAAADPGIPLEIIQPPIPGGSGYQKPRIRSRPHQEINAILADDEEVAAALCLMFAAGLFDPTIDFS